VLHREETLHIDSAFPIAFRDALSETGTDVAEIEANQFAAALLMPDEILRRDVAALGSYVNVDEATSKLAQRYQVSVPAMSIRLSHLNLLA
jgi:Zn-dependent peptidase ImmA (M78 family)